MLYIIVFVFKGIILYKTIIDHLNTINIIILYNIN